MANEEEERRVTKPDPTAWGSFSEMLESLVAYVDLHDKLADALVAYGTTVAEILEGINDVDIEARFADPKIEEKTGEVETVLGPVARHWVTKWTVHGFTPEQIAILLSRTWWQRDAMVEVINRYLSTRAGKVVLDERRVMELHKQGYTPLEIHRITGYVRQSIDQCLRNLNITPHQKLKRVDDKTRQRVIAMRNRGATYGELKAACGVTDNQIRSILRYAAQRGLVPDYGKKAVS